MGASPPANRRDDAEKLKQYLDPELRSSQDQLLSELAAVREQNRVLVEQLAAAMSGSKSDREFRRAALNLMEDAISAREVAQLEIAVRRRAEGALREADRRKDEFLALLAHELRNPLTPIRNSLSVLKETSGDQPAIQEAAEMMDDQVDHIVRLVDDLLDVSRITRGMIDLRFERIDVAPLLQKAARAARPYFGERRLSLTAPAEPLVVRADPTRLLQILVNLLHNAAKFTSSDGQISLTAERSSEWAVLRVSDDGIGLAADQQARIFDMFTQVDSSQRRSQGGLGIGLSLVKSLVELHGGTIEVVSEGLDRGSEFVMRLPLAGAMPASTADDNGSAADARAATGGRVLVVDDHRLAADSLATLLNHQGFDVHARYGGLDALAAAEELRPDAIVLDIGMPNVDGYEVCRRIREQRWGRDMTLVALTGWGQESDLRRTQEAGFDAHLVKPPSANELKEVLGTLLAARSPRK